MISNINLGDLDFVKDEAICLADNLCLTQKNHCDILITIDVSLKMPFTRTIFRFPFLATKNAKQACTKSIQSSRKK